MCANKCRDIVKISCFLFIIDVISSVGYCQNAGGGTIFAVRSEENINPWSASTEEKRTLDEETTALMNRELAEKTEVVPQANGNKNQGFHPASDSFTVLPIMRQKESRGKRRRNKSLKNISADIRDNEMKSAWAQIKKEPDFNDDVSQNEIKELRGRAERMRKYRGQHRRKRKYLDKNLDKEGRIRKSKKERNGRRRKAGRKRNDNNVRLFFSGIRPNKNNLFLEPFDNITSEKSKNKESDISKEFQQMVLENPTLTTSNIQVQQTSKSRIPIPPEPTKHYRNGEVRDGKIEKEFSKYLEKEISKSRLESLPYIKSNSEDKYPRKTGFPDLVDNEIKTWKDQREVEARYRVPKPSGYESPQFDVQSMLGYAKTKEDLPILEMEKEVLQRTMQDYNAYMSSNLFVGKLTGARKQPIEQKSNDLKISRETDMEGASKEVTDDEEIKGDLSCINGTFLPAPLVSHALIKYVKSSIPGQEYLEADYECAPGFYMASNRSKLLCKSRRWVGLVPNCKIRQKVDGSCDQVLCEKFCKGSDSRAQCSCSEGFKPEGQKCIDINECEEDNGDCEFECINTVGSYHCDCPQGMTQGEDKYTCKDVNECVLNEGHGPCEDTCHNLVGGYECSCDGLPGTILSSDNHTCQEAGPCSISNAGCSHTCLSTMGRVFCLCPDGFMLEDDWKTCQDVNECEVPDLQTEVCHYGCINTPGSYRCAHPLELKVQPISEDLPDSCLSGYKLSSDGSCIDINECAEGNGGCNEVCENTAGSFFCACEGDERALSSDGKSCIGMNSVSCLPMNPDGHGYLLCSRSMILKPWEDERKTTNQPGTKCFLKCPPGYQLHGEYELTCLSNGTWDGPKHGECVRYSKPRLDCPADVTAELAPGRDEAFVTFDQPSTDLDWFRYVRSKPTWGTRLEANLKLGVHVVTFYARHPVSKKQTSCILRITVTNGEAPKVQNCPSNIEVTGKNGSAITWVDPTFTDNVKVTKIHSNEDSGGSFTIGGHKIEYEASDEAGWTTKCIFTVVLREA